MVNEMIEIKTCHDYNLIFDYLKKYELPHEIDKNYTKWLEAFINDIDGGGRKLFHNLFVKAAYENNNIIGFIQYGKSIFGFEDGNISTNISYNIIRNFYFDYKRTDAASMLLNSSLEYFNNNNPIYAFFHYFGMTSNGRFGKLFDKYSYIEEFLKDHHFYVEHENVYYSLLIDNCPNVNTIDIIPHKLSEGNEQTMDFYLNKEKIGGCEIHYVNDSAAFLRYIYINDNLKCNGLGTKCIKELIKYLFIKGIRRIDTDTFSSNKIAQHFYEKNGFVSKGKARSYIWRKYV